MFYSKSKTHFMQYFTEKNAILFMIIMYSVGILGFVLDIHPDFPLLTPFNLLLSLAVALAFHQPFSTNFKVTAFIVAVAGYLVEVVGVNTGLIFGDYQYGAVLGFKLWQTPLSIGINWVLLVYCSAALVNYISQASHRIFLKALIGAVLMVALDVLIEPVAIKTGMWIWAGGIVPLKNYVGWFFSALVLQYLMFSVVKNHQNSVARAIFYLQILFFLALNIFL